MDSDNEKKEYTVIFSTIAEKELKALKKQNNWLLLQKIEEIILEIVVSPRLGRGKPERLKGYGDDEVWSRRVTSKDRIVYQIIDNTVEILILKLFGHYNDK